MKVSLKGRKHNFFYPFLVNQPVDNQSKAKKKPEIMLISIIITENNRNLCNPIRRSIEGKLINEHQNSAVNASLSLAARLSNDPKRAKIWVLKKIELNLNVKWVFHWVRPVLLSNVCRMHIIIYAEKKNGLMLFVIVDASPPVSYQSEGARKKVSLCALFSVRLAAAALQIHMFEPH